MERYWRWLVRISGGRSGTGDGLLQCLELLRERRVRCGYLPEAREGANDIHTHLHGARAAQYRRGHDGAVFRERQLRAATSAPT